MRRLDHLNNSLQTAIRSAATILQNVGVDQSTSTHAIRVAYDTFAYTTKHVTPTSSFQWEDFQLLDASTEISVAYQAGGTRQDLGLRDAGFFSWDTTQATQKYVILITDGAPVSSGATDEVGKDVYKIMENVKAQAKVLTDRGITLITVGLSTQNVIGGSNLLYEIASDIDGQRQFYEAESGDDMEAILLKILRTIISHAELRGQVTDTVDPVFYPVDAAGDPISEGLYDMSGAKLNAAPTDGTTPYYQWEHDDTTDCWTITWYNQLIGWEDENTDWHEHFYLKTKENFLGGNTINTNVDDAVITPDGVRPKGDANWTAHTFKPEDQAKLPTPYVNIDELALTHNETQWDVYLDTQVDPKTQLDELFKAIDVLKVVSGSTNEMITSKGQMLGDTSENASERFKLGSITSLSSLASNLTSDQWSDLLKGDPVEVQYDHYGHKNVGKIIISLEQAGNAHDLETSPHAASIAGNSVEHYTLTVTYVPTDETTPDGGWHTTQGGTRGASTDSMTSVNTHVINVFDKGLAIRKVNQEGDLITSDYATFALYREDDSGKTPEELGLSVLPAGKKFALVGTANTANGCASFDPVYPSSKNGVPGDYYQAETPFYLVETKAPAGYNMLTEALTASLAMTDTKTELNVNGAAPYNWTQAARLMLNGDTVTLKRTDATETTDLTNTGISQNSEIETLYYQVPNTSGYELPSTGGPGTALYTILGSLLILGAAFLLLRRRRDC